MRELILLIVALVVVVLAEIGIMSSETTVKVLARTTKTKI